MARLSEELGLGSLQINISNRKITQGFFETIGLDQEAAQKVMRIIQDRDNLGIDGMRSKFYNGLKFEKTIAELCLSFSKIKTQDSSFRQRIEELGLPTEKMEEGINELSSVINGLSQVQNVQIYADLSVVRGMNYYTGTVYEGRINLNPKYPPIMVGGRYDSMVGHFMKDSHPGVGFSFELTSAMRMLLDLGIKVDRILKKLLSLIFAYRSTH